MFTIEEVLPRILYIRGVAVIGYLVDEEAEIEEARLICVLIV